MPIPLASATAPLAIAPAPSPASPPGVGGPSFSAVLRAQLASRARPASAAPGGAAAAPDPRALALKIERARQRLDAALAQARQGRTFSAQELLALQADAYRFSQTLDVAARVVEHGAQSVKQAVNTQV